MEKQLSYNSQICTVATKGSGLVSVTDSQGETVTVEMHNAIGGSYQVQTTGGRATGEAVRHRNTIWVRWEGKTYTLELEQGTAGSRGRKKSSGDLTSPMPGQVIKVLVEEGSSVQAGDTLLVVEAMKMQLEIKAPQSGVIQGLPHREGDSVGAGELLVHLKASE